MYYGNKGTSDFEVEYRIESVIIIIPSLSIYLLLSIGYSFSQIALLACIRLKGVRRHWDHQIIHANSSGKFIQSVL